MFLLLKKIPILLTEYRDELTRGSTQLRYKRNLNDLNAVDAAPFPARCSKAVNNSADYEAFSICPTLWKSVELRLVSFSTHLNFYYHITTAADCQLRFSLSSSSLSKASISSLRLLCCFFG